MESQIDPTVLVVDDDPSVRGVCAALVEDLGIEVHTAETPGRALALLESGQFDIVIADVHMPEGSGIELLRAIRQNHPGVEVLIMTGFGNIPEAVESVKLGAFNYITKPFTAQDFRQQVEQLIENYRTERHNHLLREQLRTQRGFGSLVGTSAAMQRVYQTILKVCSKRHPVLILGESGTGKELVARAIHHFSPLRDRAFVPVDCGALTPTLIESELFGHVRGAFTGATQARVGLLAAAGGGTVFLDEIGELPVELQAKLLRAIQEREIRPLGSNETMPLQARIIAATNRNLEEGIQRGTFREDLYFRLNVVSIVVPPLRERSRDIPALAQFFVERHGGLEEGITGFSPQALERLLNYAWPGNVRELENCVQRALALGNGPLITPADLPPALEGSRGAVPQMEAGGTLQNMERRAILNALETANGDRAQAARLLGIGKTTIYRKLKEYGIEEGPSLEPLKP